MRSLFPLVVPVRWRSGKGDIFSAKETDGKCVTLGFAKQYSTVAANQPRPALSPHFQLHNSSIKVSVRRIRWYTIQDV